MKKIMRSVLLLALAGVMVFSMAACGEKKVEEEPVTTPVVDETDIKESELKSEVVEVSLSIADIVDTLKATYGAEFNATQELEADVLETLVGISPDMYEEYYAAVAPISAHCDTLIVVRALEDKAAEVEKLLNDYREKRLNDTMEYPANLPKIAASVVDVQYDFIIFRMLGGMYMPETTETGEVVETEDSKEIENTFYVQETERGTIALNDLYEFGFTAMDESEREVNSIDSEEEVVTEAEEVAEVEEKEEATEAEEKEEATEAEEKEDVTETEEKTEEVVTTEDETEKVEDVVEDTTKAAGEAVGAAVEAVKEATEKSDAE